ncbi:YrhC family protein [Neobacillus sp. SAB-20_R2A]|uniref:YrhC family protein n=1 Tax=Neobacillus sp. SAB-20_R2A TaxID=3120519 RepID=UPI003C6DFD12
MKQHTQGLFDKMVDFKRFGTVLLAVGIFFFIGVIIPSDTKTEMDLNILILSSMSFLAASILFFTFSKQCEMKLRELEDGKDYSSKK